MDLDLERLRELAEEDPEAAKEMVRQYRKAMIVLARDNPSWFCQYVLKDRDGGMIRQKAHHHKMHELVRNNLRSAIWTFPACGKDLPIDTLLPTPSGWKCMGDIAVGDEVYSRDGKPTKVTYLSPIFTDHTCYELTFDDGQTVVAGREHQWLAYHTLDRHKPGNPFRTVTTEEIANSVRHGDRNTWSIPLTAPVEYPAADLPIHPYVMGVWLGDGDSQAPNITCHEDDRAIWDRCVSLIDEPSQERLDKRFPHILRSRLGGKLTAKAFRSLGVMGNSYKSKSKYIPEVYLRASIEQRRELLAGLLDTDGSASKRAAGRVEFAVGNEALANGATELIRSLGYKASLTKSAAKLYGVQKGWRYRINFTARDPVFWLKRKLDIQMTPATERYSPTKARYIAAAKIVDTVSTRCIAVENPEHTYLFGKDYTVTHNTTQLAVGHLLWRLGKEPNKSFGILSKSGREASKTIEALKCEARGAKILAADGSWVEVQNLKEWTKVKTFDPATWSYVDVTARSQVNGVVQCYQIKLANGHYMLLTPDHPVFIEDKGGCRWEMAKRVEKHHKLLAIRRFDIENPTSDEDIPPEAAEMLGYLLAGRKVPGTSSIVVRDNNRNEHWKARRAAFFEKAGWTVTQYGKWSLKISPATRFETPADYVNQVVTYKHGWPVELHPSVWGLSDDSLRRLVSAFMSSAFLRILKRDKKKLLSGTIGFGNDRVPNYIEHPCRETLDLIRRLCLRLGIVAEVHKRPTRNKTDIGGIWVQPKTEHGRPLYSLRIKREDISRYWPTHRQKSQPQTDFYFESVVSVQKLPKFFETWAVEVQEHQHSYISGGVLSHNTYIAESPELKDVFPHLKPGPKWAANSFTVERSTIRRDPSVIAVGLTGQFLGARLDGLVIDDVDTSETVLTVEARDQTEQVVRTKALTRLSEDGWAVAIGNVWHEDDLMHRMVNKTNWASIKLPVIDPETGESNDPEMFPMDRIHAIRDEDNPTAFAQLYLLKARADGDERFKMEWIMQSLEKGKHMELSKNGVPKVPFGCRTITGVDLGVKKKASSDPTAITTILEIPQAGNRVQYELLNLEFGRWNAQEIMNRIDEQQHLFNSEVWVESNGAQDFLIQLMNMSGRQYKISAFYTGRNKYDPMFGVESLAAEMATGCWAFPSIEGNMASAEPEIQRLCDEMAAYMPGDHTGDLLMSLWIAREGARMSRPKTQQTVEFGRIRLRR